MLGRSAQCAERTPGVLRQADEAGDLPRLPRRGPAPAVDQMSNAELTRLIDRDAGRIGDSACRTATPTYPRS